MYILRNLHELTAEYIGPIVSSFSTGPAVLGTSNGLTPEDYFLFFLFLLSMSLNRYFNECTLRDRKQRSGYYDYKLIGIKCGDICKKKNQEYYFSTRRILFS